MSKFEIRKRQIPKKKRGKSERGNWSKGTEKNQFWELDLEVADLPRRNHMAVPGMKASTITQWAIQSGPNLTQSLLVRKHRLPISLRNGAPSSSNISFSIPSYPTLPRRPALRSCNGIVYLYFFFKEFCQLHNFHFCL